MLNYILLRRKSSLLIPTTCYYSFDNSSIISVLSDEDKKYYGNNIHHDQNSQNAHIDNFPLNVPDIYREEFFIESDEIEAMIIQPKKFTDCLIKQGVSIHKIEYINTNRECDIFRDNTYKNIFGNITEEDAISRRADLFFKDKNNYAHQNELRCIIPSIVFKNFSNHITLHINNLKTGILEHIPYNATEYDMIYGVNNLVAAGRINLSTV